MCRLMYGYLMLYCWFTSIYVLESLIHKVCTNTRLRCLLQIHELYINDADMDLCDICITILIFTVEACLRDV